MPVQLVIYNELNTDAIMASYLHWLKHKDGESSLLFSGVNQKNYKEYKNMDVRFIGDVVSASYGYVRSPKDINLTIIGMTLSLSKLLELGGTFKSVTHIDNNMGSYLSLIKDVEASQIHEYKHVNALGNQLKWRLSNIYTQVSYVKSITSIEYKRLFPKGLTDLEIQSMNCIKEPNESSSDNVKKSNPTLLRFDELSEEDRLRLDKIILEVINDKTDGDRIHPFLDLHMTLHLAVGIEHLQNMLNKGEEKIPQKEPKYTSSEIYEYVSKALDMSNEMIYNIMEKGIPIKEAMRMTRQHMEVNPPTYKRDIKMKDLVLYHANCNDGLFAAYAHWLSKGSNANTIYLPVDYNETRGMSDSGIVEHLRSKVNYEDLSRVNVYVLDFSYPFAVISALSDMCNSVTLLDHHESAMLAFMKELNKHKSSLSHGVFEHKDTRYSVMFDMNQSGAMLAFKHFFPYSKDIPIWFKLVEDRDLWKFKYPETKAFALGVRNFLEEKSLTGVELFKRLHEMLSTEYNKYLSIGNVLLNAQQARVDALKDLGYYTTDINGYKSAFINAEIGISSDLANSIIEDGEVKIVIVYYILEVDGELLANLSIRSYKDVDSTFIAKALGGGGHPNACGARVTKKLLDKFLELREITF